MEFCNRLLVKESLKISIFYLLSCLLYLPHTGSSLEFRDYITLERFIGQKNIPLKMVR